LPTAPEGYPRTWVGDVFDHLTAFQVPYVGCRFVCQPGAAWHHG